MDLPHERHPTDRIEESSSTCLLYTGTFGSFIGFSAAFPLLSKILFPDVDALAFAFLGPLVGAVARAVAGKPCDRFGGGRITLWVFVAMCLGTLGILYAIGSSQKLDRQDLWRSLLHNCSIIK